MSEPIPPSWGPFASRSTPTETPALARSIAVAINRNIIAGVVAHKGTPNKRKCVLAAALGIRVFPKFGFEATAVPVETYAFHLRYRQLFDPVRGGFTDPTIPFSYAGASGPATGKETTDWQGHLVLDVEGQLVDSMAGQFVRLALDPVSKKLLNSPEDFLVTDSVVVSAKRRPADNVAQFAEFQYPEGNAVLMYRQQPHNTGYTDNPFWTLTAELDSIAEDIEADIRQSWSQGDQELSVRSPIVRLGSQPPKFSVTPLPVRSTTSARIVP